MQEFPHHYTVTATAFPLGDVELKADCLSTIRSASPVQFDGPGDRWSPETLVTAAVGDCLILTFRAVAGAAKLAWTSLECHVTGTLERVERTTQFVRFEVHARLQLAAGAELEAGRRALEKAEKNCLISNSLKAAIHLTTSIDVAMSSAGAFTTA